MIILAFSLSIKELILMQFILRGVLYVVACQVVESSAEAEKWKVVEMYIW